MTLFWCILWVFFVFDKPENHPNITEHELSLLSERKSADNHKLDIPYKDLLSSQAVWAFIVGQIGTNYHFYFAVSLFPVYMSRMLNASPGRAGLYSAMPLAVHIITILLFARLCDYIASIWKLRKIRQIFIIIGFL